MGTPNLNQLHHSVALPIHMLLQISPGRSHKTRWNKKVKNQTIRFKHARRVKNIQTNVKMTCSISLMFPFRSILPYRNNSATLEIEMQNKNFAKNYSNCTHFPPIYSFWTWKVHIHFKTVKTVDNYNLIIWKRR